MYTWYSINTFLTCKQPCTQSIWMNKDITINNKCIYWKSWKNDGILYINDIINKTNGHFLTHNELKMKYNIKTNQILTLHGYYYSVIILSFIQKSHYYDYFITYKEKIITMMVCIWLCVYIYIYFRHLGTLYLYCYMMNAHRSK